MSTIVLSSEDEDELLILDADEQVNVQPPHMVFILEDQTNGNLLKEDDSESNEDQTLGKSCNLWFEEPENILPEALSSPFPKEVFENERPLESDNWTTQPNKNYQSFSDEDTCDFKRFEHNYVNNNLDIPAKEIAKQDNNAIFQRLAEALSTAISSPLDIKTEVPLNNKRGDIDLRSKENKIVDTDNATNSKFVKTNEPLNQTNTKSQSCQISVENAAVTVKKRGRKLGWRKNPIQNPSKIQISGHSSTPNKKKPGRKPGWRKSIEPNPSTQTVSKENTSTTVRKPGRKLGWRKNSTQNPSKIQISGHSSTPNKKKPGRKPGLRKSIEPNPSTQTVSNENTSTTVRKPGRKLGWRKNSTQNPSKIQISGHSSTPNKKKPGRKPGLRKSIEPNPSTQTVSNENTSTTVRKPGRKLGWRKSPKDNTQVYSNQETISDRSKDEVDLNEIIKSNYIHDKNKSARKIVTQKKINKSSRAVIDHELFKMEMGNKTIHLSSKNNGNQVIPRGSSDLLNPSSDSSLQHSTPFFGGPNKPERLLKLNTTFIEDLNESCVNNLPDPNPSLNVQPKLTGNAEQDAVILQEDFVRCYNKIFNTNTERLSTSLGDMLLLAMSEVKHYKERINSAKKLTCETLRKEEMYITEDSFKNTLDKYRTSFCAVFHEILSHIMSNEEVIYQQKALLLAVFLKIFVRVSTLSPEYLDSLILAKYSMNSLLKDYLLTAPESIYVILSETFWQGDTDFERNCWFILDFCLTSLSGENDNCNNMLDKTDGTATLKTVNQYLNNKFQPQAVNSGNGAEVSVIVRNQYHQEERCSSTAKSNHYSGFHTVRQTDNHVNSSLSNTFFKQFSSGNTNNESEQYAANNMQSATEENGNSSKSTDQGSLSRPTEIHNAIFLQTHQHATLDSLQPNYQTIIKENTTTGFVGVKRKTFPLENCSIKMLKKTENQLPVNPTTYSQQNIPTNSESTNAIGLLQTFEDNSLHGNGFNADNLNRSFNISNPNSEVRRGFSPSYYGCKGSDFTLTPNSDKIVSSVQTADKDTHGYGVTLPHAYPQNSLPFQQGPVNLSTSRAYMDSCHKPIESKSLPTERNPYNHQRTRYTPYYESQQNLGFHQAQIYSAAYGQKPSYHNQTSTQYNQYSNSSVNYQLQNQPNLRHNQAALRYHQHPNLYTPTYGCSTYRTDPRLDIISVKSATEKPLFSDTHIVTQEICPSTLPKQMQRIRSNSGITINNYNINTYVPPTMPQHTSQINLGPYLSQSQPIPLTRATYSKENMC